MPYTLFTTPVIKTILRVIALILMKILGWKIYGQTPAISKYVLVWAPHTTNWDVFYGILLAYTLKVDVQYMAKEELCKGPFGPVMKWLAAIPIDRSKANNTVEATIQLFKENDKLIIAIPPEGTRSKAKAWKTGFYYIAHGAGVPIILAFADYKRKIGGIGPSIIPSGDIEADMEIIREFYANISGKYTEQTSPIVLAETKDYQRVKNM